MHILNKQQWEKYEKTPGHLGMCYKLFPYVVIRKEIYKPISQASKQKH